MSFLLVHGGWHGGWCWRDVVRPLVLAGHRAHPVTLTGLGERAHLLTPSINLETHVVDVLAALEAEELREVTLVVHSYAGLVGTAVADRVPERLSHLVYVDAVVPEPGESWCTTHPREIREARLAAAKASPDFTIQPPDPSAFGLSGALYDWVKRRQTPQPGHTYDQPLQFDPVRVAQVPRTFVSCTRPANKLVDVSRQRISDPHFWGGAWKSGGGVRFIELETGHDAMVSAPDALAKVLLDGT